MKEDCNRCDTTRKCAGKSNPDGCSSFVPPKDTWMLAELALAHPDSLNRALSALPFDTNLGFYLK